MSRRAVVLTGRKRALIEPVVLKGKSLRIEFDGGGDSLQVEPATRAGNRPSALFRVEGGRLDLVNARLRIPGSESASHPLRLLQVVDGSFCGQELHSDRTVRRRLPGTPGDRMVAGARLDVGFSSSRIRSSPAAHK
ncbi:MAG: hypothetical protein U0992_22325 [Planctomycetaceae bacterium]